MLFSVLLLSSPLAGYFFRIDRHTAWKSHANGARSIEMASHEAIVVTGMGIISPNGLSVTKFYDNICQGVSGISKLDRFDASPFKCQIAGQIRDFNPKDYFKSKKKIGQNDLYTHFAVAASHLALADANIDLKAEGINPYRVC